MHSSIRKAAALLLSLGLLLSLCGCAAGSVSDLYALPQPSEAYLHLQAMIDEEISAGCEYAAPSSGTYRQVVHAADLNGDGVTEAVAFLRDPDGVPKLCIYSQDSGEYALLGTISGEGSSIGSFDYADMDGDGCCELVVTWQASTGIGILYLYSIADGPGDVILTTDCTAFRFADMDGNGRYALLVLHADGTGSNTVDLFTLDAAQRLSQSTAALSTDLGTVERMRTGLLSDGAAALYVEGSCGEGGTLTDILVASGSSLKCVTTDRFTGVGTTSRDCVVYATDIDGDRVLEIPDAEALPEYSEDSGLFWIYDWYTYDSAGGREKAITTYHCTADGWYLVLPEGMRDGLVIRRADASSGEKAVVLSELDEQSGETRDLLYIYTLTGDNRRDRAKSGERFTLAELSSTIYAARLPEGSPYSREEILDSFNIIYSEWNTGTL